MVPVFLSYRQQNIYYLLFIDEWTCIRQPSRQDETRDNESLVEDYRCPAALLREGFLGGPEGLVTLKTITERLKNALTFSPSSLPRPFFSATSYAISPFSSILLFSLCSFIQLLRNYIFDQNLVSFSKTTRLRGRLARQPCTSASKN